MGLFGKKKDLPEPVPEEQRDGIYLEFHCEKALIWFLTKDSVMVRDKGINLKPGVYLLSGITRLWHEEAEGKLLSPCVICFIADGKTTMLRYYEKEKEQGKRAFCYMYGEMLLGQMKDGEIRRRFCNRCEKTFEFSRGDLLDNRKRIEDPEAARAALLPESVPDVSQLNTLGQILAEKLTGIRDFSVCPFCGSSGVTDLPAE